MKAALIKSADKLTKTCQNAAEVQREITAIHSREVEANSKIIGHKIIGLALLSKIIFANNFSL